MSLYFLLPAVLLPVGAVYLLILGRKRPWFRAVGVVFLLLFVVGLLFFYPILLWAFDSLIGWELRHPAEIPGHTVTLVQEPGCDFYNSYFEIKRRDGKIATVMIDGDDYRWWNPDVVRKDRRIYFVRGSGQIGDRTSYVDPENDIIFSGYYQETHKISELEFN